MRHLTFDYTDKNSRELYDCLYQGVLGTYRPLDKKEVRVMSSILDKFEHIGKPVSEEDGAKFALSSSGTVILEEAEYKLMADCLDKVHWTTKYARRANRGLAWFDAISEYAPEVEARPAR